MVTLAVCRYFLIPLTSLFHVIIHCTDGSSYPAEINGLNLVHFSLQLSSALRFLKGRKLLHGDVAARNALVCDGLVVKLTDFGLACAVSSGNQNMHINVSTEMDR